MKISKSASTIPGSGTPTEEQLLLVNQQSKTPLTAEEVYVCSLRLCDDRVDRDGERFDRLALPKLGELFLGKPGIVDHNWSAEKQVARIFHTEVIREEGFSSLVAWAYIPRTGREQLIADIESGIRREVSISCSMGGRICSICGENMGECGHRAGEVYEGKTCVTVLTDPKDAYEFSFVAVPAQPGAGVRKHWRGGEEMDLKAVVEKSGQEGAKQEYLALKRMAEYGQACRREQEAEAIRMAGALELGLSPEAMENMVKGMEHDALRGLVRELSGRMDRKFIPESQLAGEREEDQQAYLI